LGWRAVETLEAPSFLPLGMIWLRTRRRRDDLVFETHHHCSALVDPAWCRQQPATAPTEPLLKTAELDQLLAPIALYPDPLLSEVLIASTYPLEVVQAERWVKSNNAIKRDALIAALSKQSWDDSLKSLVEVPDVLAMMSEQLDWTQKLGDAVLAQQTDVLDAIQRLRARAQANGKLESTKEQTVTVKTENQKQYVAIEPTPPTEIYVPYYEPSVVYGDWPYPDYAPYYFPSPPGYFAGGVLATGIAFAAGIAVRHAFWGNCDWGRGNINVVTNRTANVNNVNRGKWEHKPNHRRGVKYNNADVRQKFSGKDLQAGRSSPQGPRAGDRDRPAGADRAGPGAGNRERSSAATRERATAGDRNRPQPQGIGARSESGKAKAAKAAQRPNKQPGPQGRTQANRSGPSASANGGTARAANRGGGAHRPAAHAGGGGHRVAGHGGGGHRAAARSGGGRGGRRSDVALKHDIILLGRLDNGLGFYRFSYNGSDQQHVGVIAQEDQSIMPNAVFRGPDGGEEIGAVRQESSRLHVVA
jgi:hypothetical protein